VFRELLRRAGLTQSTNTFRETIFWFAAFFRASAAMHSGVACSAQRDQILLCIGSQMAAELSVVHLKIRHPTAGLTPPAVATQDLLAQTFVRHGIQPKAGGFGVNHS
jgi:hypothetical protein